ncbi:MAG: ABC transporter ATP-binding protein [Anaerolineaceae bacterium]|nr:ABC transporter ATP-binding protein [Anaerolineaceae bacterium]
MEKTTENLIEVRSLKKTYTEGSVSTEALRGIDLVVGKGEYLGIVGKSGAGKTTLLNMIAGLDNPTEGEILVGGKRVDQMNEVRKAIWRGRNVGFIFQSFQLLPGLSLLDNVMLPMDFCGLLNRHSAEKAAELLRMVGLIDHIHKVPSEISGGQQQRVAIARALANDPALLLADEPTGRLDTTTSEVVFDIFEQVVAKGTTMVIVSHDHTLAERTTRTIRLTDGEIGL